MTTRIILNMEWYKYKGSYARQLKSSGVLLKDDKAAASFRMRTDGYGYDKNSALAVRMLQQMGFCKDLSCCGCGMEAVVQEMGKLGFATDVVFDNGNALVYGWSREEEGK